MLLCFRYLASHAQPILHYSFQTYQIRPQIHYHGHTTVNKELCDASKSSIPECFRLTAKEDKVILVVKS